MIVLKVNKLSKSFIKYNKKIDMFIDLLFKTNRANLKPMIKDISFTVNQGETFGILGDNGSGKTVLLKLLASQLIPTEGTIDADGKVFRHSYMTGMQNHKTGYENIYYKCGLHGLTELEIDQIVPRIVEFSELGDAINERYGGYSTSMRSKLGFAIAINIKTDIALMDEAFAVGDGSFRAKCNDAFYKLKREGMTIVYASYSQHSIKASCDRALWIAEGEVVCIGNPTKIANLYERYLKGEKSLAEIKHGLEVGYYAIH